MSVEDQQTAPGEQTKDSNTDVNEANGQPPETNAADDAVKHMNSEQMLHHIQDLRAENAKRRVAVKKMKEDLENTAKSKTESEVALNELKAKLAEIEQKEKEKELAEKTLIEQTQIKYEETKSEYEKLMHELEKERSEKAKLSLSIKRSNRENEIREAVNQSGYSFSSKFEETGFMNQFASIGEDGNFSATDDEIREAITSLAKKQKIENLPETPQTTGKTKGSAPPIKDEILDLLKKSSQGALTSVESARLAELSKNM